MPATKEESLEVLRSLLAQCKADAADLKTSGYTMATCDMQDLVSATEIQISELERLVPTAETSKAASGTEPR